MVFTMLFSQNNIYARQVCTEVDDFLLSVGVPVTVIEHLTETQRKNIFMSFQNEDNISFESFSLTAYNISECGEDIVKVDVLAMEVENLFTPRHTIPPSDLTISVVAMQGGTGADSLWLAPSFVWHTPRNIRNDGFAWSLFPGWAVDASVSFSLWARYIGNGQLIMSHPLNPVAATFSGYGFMFDGPVGLPWTVEGHGMFRAIRTNPNATRAISLMYVHDATPPSRPVVGYRLSSSPTASIGISTASDNAMNLFTMARNVPF